MKNKQKGLPKQLQNLVSQCLSLLGEVIKEEGGDKLYNQVESIRLKMIEYRKAGKKDQEKLLTSLYRTLEKAKSSHRHDIVTANTLMLELINVCETAYRTFRIRQSQIHGQLAPSESSIVFVLTAHPTEVRSTDNMFLFQRIQNVCVRILEQTGEENYLLSIIKHNLKLAWLIPVTKHKKPEVLDEANHLFSILLRKDILDTILRTNRDYHPLRIRTWVGGDKDGHPGIDDKVMLDCLNASRNKFAQFLDSYLDMFVNELTGDTLGDFIKKGQNLKSLTKKIRKIKPGDLNKVKEIKAQVLNLQKEYVDKVGAKNPRLDKVEQLFSLFPGLVIPIELREDSEVIAQAVNAKTKDFAISRMLSKLKELAGDYSIRNYAQGFVISMFHTNEDFNNAYKLQMETVGKIEVPIIPLFETDQALADSYQLVEKIIANKTYTKNIKKLFYNRLEVMLGYSDSSKGMGVLASRVNIAKTLRNLDQLISSKKFTPVFFHGSGGSVDRGGGKLVDQTAWWPKSALNLYKATVQGEMVERYFTSPEVVSSNCHKIIKNSQRSKVRSGPIKISKIVDEFSDQVEEQYAQKLQEPLFLKMVEAATPYSYLDVLKLGSRPTKRKKEGPLDFSSIRAIPWILCWTQTRLLFPTWWGIGTAWQKIKRDDKKRARLVKAYKESPLFASFVRTLGFTLSKVDFSVFKLYLSHSDLNENEKEEIINTFSKELSAATQFVREVSGERSLLWHTPWLDESIKLRSSMIHPLNVLQILGHKDDDQELVRKTVAGISCGMLTTG